MSRRVHGIIAALGYQTEDGRRINRDALTVRLGGDASSVRLGGGPASVELPLMALTAPGDGHDGARIVGIVHRVWVDEDDWTVHAEGLADDVVPEGEHPCGVDLSEVTFELLDGAGGLLDYDRFMEGGEGAPEIVQVCTAGRLLAVTMYLPGSTAIPSFPVARLVVD